MLRLGGYFITRIDVAKQYAAIAICLLHWGEAESRSRDRWRTSGDRLLGTLGDGLLLRLWLCNVGTVTDIRGSHADPEEFLSLGKYGASASVVLSVKLVVANLRGASLVTGGLPSPTIKLRVGEDGRCNGCGAAIEP